jgi:hypothetical protein
MLVTKEVLRALKQSRQITIVKKTDGNVYIVSEIYTGFRNKKISLDYHIECKNTPDRLYVVFYSSTDMVIDTVISHINVNDTLSLSVRKHELTSETFLYDVYVTVERQTKREPKKYTYLIYTTTPEYIG